MASTLRIKCRGCQYICNTMPISRRDMDRVLNDEDPETRQVARDMLELKKVMVFCQKKNKVVII